jgi:arylsulfatase A-like enzyme
MARFTRRRFLELAGATGVVACSGEGSVPVPGTDDPPDDTASVDTHDTGTPLPSGPAPIIYLFVDQLRGDHLGCTGHPVAHTPTFDAIASEAVTFRRCFTNAPSCRAARTTMMTGLPVAEHGVYTNIVRPDPALPSHVRELQAAGYHTMVIGKTHLHDGRGHLDDHLAQLAAWGFDDAIELPDPQQEDLQSAHSDYLRDTTPTGEDSKYARWQSYVRTYTWDQDPPDLPPWNLSTDDHLDRFCGRTAADWIRAWSDEKPLYLQVNFPGPHKPFDPTSEYRDLYDPADPALPLPILQRPAPPLAPLTESYLQLKEEPWTEQSARELAVSYLGKVSLVDAAVADVVAALVDAGLWDRAWVIVHSDHGELLADHLMTGKVLGYEGAIHVPLLVKPPGGVPTPWTDDGLVDQLDVTASILAMAGLDPAGFGDRDLTDRVTGGPDGPQAHATKVVLFENLGMVGLRTDDTKLTWDLELGLPVELYDLVADPDELRNRVTDPAHRDTVDTLVALLRERRTLPVDNYG